jgi:hypothetical protein
LAFALGGAYLQAAPVTFTKQIAPLMFKHCAVCHRPGEVAPFPLLTYADVAKRAAQIEEILVRGAMPPWKPRGEHSVFLNDRRLSAAEIALFGQWVADGSLEGAAADLPTTPQFREGWQLGTPNVVLTLPEPIRVPADGRDLHLNVVLPLVLPPGTYLKAAEFRPSNPRVVHHALLFIDRAARCGNASTRFRSDSTAGKVFARGARHVGAGTPPAAVERRTCDGLARRGGAGRPSAPASHRQA